MQGKPNKLNDERLPPYMSYRTWQKLLSELSSNNVPSRFDHSYFDNLNITGSSRSIARGTFQFLGLISNDGLPTQKLHQLVKAEGPARGNTLAEIIRNAYEPLFSALDVTKGATQSQLREFFKSQGVSGDIERKCLSFFFALAADANLTLSPHLKKPSSRGRGKRAGGND
ncbi:MAG: DUF5343 domain-containing protein, partial [Chloroflexi bacterium]|nr:DUF5343 domain-containing protein [Chloroflexota bacterium]